MVISPPKGKILSEFHRVGWVVHAHVAFRVVIHRISMRRHLVFNRDRSNDTLRALIMRRGFVRCAALGGRLGQFSDVFD